MARKRRASVPDYPFAKFLEHFEEAHRLGEQARTAGEELDQTSMMIRILESMRARYSREESAYKAAKFTMAMGYLADHMDDWDVSDYGVTGSEASGSLIGEHVLQAVHEAFIAVPNGRHLVDEPSPEWILHRVRELRNA